MINIKAHGSEENYDLDKISRLPDDVRIHILSFLSTREAVQTCILSKTWRKTWASVLDLKFDSKESGLPEVIDEQMAEEFVTKFELLVKSVLEKREISRVNRFQLRLHFQVYWPRTQAVADYISDVLKLEPKECSVEIGSREKLNLNTDLIFTCASLIYLQLWFSNKSTDLVAIEPNSVNLPCLKTLVLVCVKMSNESLKKLLLGCPVLEELVLRGCYIDIIEICSNTLKKLILRSWDRLKILLIVTPNLIYLDIKLNNMEEIVLPSMPLLVHASIFIPGLYVKGDQYVTRGPQMIHNLSNVQSLQLQFKYPGKKVLQKDISDYPVFNNLKRLKLMNWSLYDFDLAPFLLLSPKLEELIILSIDGGRVRQFLDEEATREGPRDALVQREFLKTVRIGEYMDRYINDNGFVDRLIKKLFAHIKIIGKITLF
ncbi:F-box protein At4g22280-like [Carex rostrata]